MPPRKRARLTPSTSTKASPEAETSTPTPSSPAPRSSRSGTHRIAIPATSPEESPLPSTSVSPGPSSPWLPDPWTAPQETALFKALIRHKPTGIHKHFHMLSISSYLQSHGHSYPRNSSARDKAKSFNDDKPTHTHIPGIWDKLSTLYDLAALDERSDAYAFGTDVEATTAVSEDFHLPGEPVTHGPASPSSPLYTSHGQGDGDEDEQDEDEVYFASLIWARRFPNPEIESDMDFSSPEPEFLPFRRGPDGSVETATPTRGPASSTTRARKSDAKQPVATPGPASGRRKSVRRDVSTRASGTPVTDAAGEDKDDTGDAEENEEGAEDGEEEEEEEEEKEEAEEEEEEEDGGDDQTEGEEDEEIEDDEDELGDTSTAPAARSTRSSARTRRR